MLFESGRSAGNPVTPRRVRGRLIAVGVFLIAVVATPPGWWLVYLLQIAMLAAIVRFLQIPLRILAERWLYVGPFLLLLALGVPLSRGLAGGWELMLSVFLKSILSYTAVLVLVESTPTSSLLQGLLALGAPSLLVSVVALMVRYRYLFAEELARMTLAKRARTFRPSRLLDWRILPNFVGILFLRGLARAERVHDAMLARGWNGSLPYDADDTPISAGGERADQV